MPVDVGVISRAQGCLLGQLAGDALGSLVEFQRPEAIKQAYPSGVRELADGGTWNTLAGQPTDDSEMALSLARMLVKEKNYRPEKAFESYVAWLNTYPFDKGQTITSALHGRPDDKSQANGALMRISPLGIFGAGFGLNEVKIWAEQDAALTHPNSLCQQVNALYVMAIAYAVKTGAFSEDIYGKILKWAKEMSAEDVLLDTIKKAEHNPPDDYIKLQGWVLIAFQNALWQLLHAPTLEAGVVDTVMRGGDTDTNAAVCGALLGAVYGRDAVPEQWVEKILSCRPERDLPNVHKPRPASFWPVDALELSEALVSIGIDGEI